MKRTYTKPSFAIEHFTLTESVASSCGYNKDSYFGMPTHDDKYNCGWKIDGEIYWFDADHTCNVLVGEEFEYEEYCYNAPSGVMTIFAS